MPTIRYFDLRAQAHTDIIDPSPQDIRHHIDALGRKKEHHFGVSTSVGYLGINEASKGRVFVTFSHHGKGAILLDPSYPKDSKKIKIVADLEGGPRSIRQTITKEKAYEVATYFLENEKLPKGLSWSENLDEFS